MMTRERLVRLVLPMFWVIIRLALLWDESEFGFSFAFCCGCVLLFVLSIDTIDSMDFTVKVLQLHTYFNCICTTSNHFLFVSTT